MPIIPMSLKELDRYDIIKRLLRYELNGTEASRLLRLSIRQVQRLKRRVREHGAQGLLHGNRGKPSNRRLPEGEYHQIVTFLKNHYADFGPTFASEKLAERHGIHRDPTTIRDLMIAEDLWTPRAAQGEHRMWRERRAALGELVQFDGSYHAWFEQRSPRGCLLSAIDDATGRIMAAQFAPHEGVVPVLRFWMEYLLAHGKPRSLYLDRFSTYRMTQRVAVENHDLQTQFQRAMKELGIEPISAYSPQAKGRVERLFGTLQDRLVKELRLAGISSVAEANHFLEETFTAKFNERFAVAPQLTIDLHRSLTATEQRELPAIFSRQETRTVMNDFTISFQNQWYQLGKDQPVTVCKKDVVTVEERLDGSVWVRLRGKYLAHKLLPERPKKTRDLPWVLVKTAPARAPYRPPAHHPWRRPFLIPQRTDSIAHTSSL